MEIAFIIFKLYVVAENSGVAIKGSFPRQDDLTLVNCGFNRFHLLRHCLCEYFQRVGESAQPAGVLYSHSKAIFLARIETTDRHQVRSCFIKHLEIFLKNV